MRGRGAVALLGLGVVASSLVACRTNAPPASTPAASAEPPADDEIGTPKAAKRDIVQPVKYGREVNEPNAEDGMIGGPLTGAVAAPPPPPPPPPPARPQNVSPQALDALRIAGEKNIIPDDATQVEILRSDTVPTIEGAKRVVGSYKLCITVEGNINTVIKLKSTRFPAYDDKIMNTIRGEWRYRPFLVNGQATPVCTAVTYIYTQHVPPPPPTPPTP